MVLTLIAIWVYFLFFNTNLGPGDKFADLDFANTDDPSAEIDPEVFNNGDEPVVDVSAYSPIRQLTTKPVAGFQHLEDTASTTPKILYIEAGTGHIFSIDLLTGQEKRISATTIPVAKRGVVTPDGRFVMVQSGFSDNADFSISEIDQESNILNPVTTLKGVVSFSPTLNNTFLYAVREGSRVVGKQYYPISQLSEDLFTIPFNEVTIDWGETALEPHHVYPKPHSQLEGYVYEIADGAFARLPIAGMGVSAKGNEEIVLSSIQDSGGIVSSLYTKELGSNDAFVAPLLPEKCAGLREEPNFICAIPEAQLGASTPDDWYQGTRVYNDNFWQINSLQNELVYKVDVSEETGRELDVINPVVDSYDKTIYFQNKNDLTLWAYDFYQ